MDFRKSVQFNLESEKLINARPLILTQFVRLENLKTLDESFRDNKVEECIQFIERLKSLCDISTSISQVSTICKRFTDIYECEFEELFPQLLNANEDFINNGEYFDPNSGRIVKDFYADDPLDLNNDQLHKLMSYYNKEYSNSIEIFRFFSSLLINGIRELHIHYLSVASSEKLTELKNSNPIIQGDQSLFNNHLEVIKQVDEDHPVNYKIHLLNCLGFLEPLEKYYKERNPFCKRDDFAKLLKELLDNRVEVGTITRVVSFALKKEEITSHKLKEKLSKTLNEHNFEDKTRLE